MKVKPETEDPFRLEGLISLHLGAHATTSRRYAVRSVRFQPFRSSWTIVLGLEGVESIDAAEALRGQFVYAQATDLPELQEGEWLIDDLVGLQVFLESGDVVGSVRDVLDLPAHPTLVISRGDGEDALVPAVSPVVTEVNVAERRIVISPIDGLLD